MKTILFPLFDFFGASWSAFLLSGLRADFFTNYSVPEISKKQNES